MKEKEKNLFEWDRLFEEPQILFQQVNNAIMP